MNNTTSSAQEKTVKKETEQPWFVYHVGKRKSNVIKENLVQIVINPNLISVFTMNEYWNQRNERNRP